MIMIMIMIIKNDNNYRAVDSNRRHNTSGDEAAKAYYADQLLVIAA